MITTAGVPINILAGTPPANCAPCYFVTISVNGQNGLIGYPCQHPVLPSFQETEYGHGVALNVVVTVTYGEVDKLGGMWCITTPAGPEPVDAVRVVLKLNGDYLMEGYTGVTQTGVVTFPVFYLNAGDYIFTVELPDVTCDTGYCGTCGGSCT